MVIDAHTHLGKVGSGIAKPEDLIVSMRKNRIDRAVILAGHLNNFPTERAIAISQKYKQYFIAVGSVSPLSPQKPSLKLVGRWLKEKLIHGLKFYPGYEYFYPSDSILKPYLSLLEKYNLPAIFHTGLTYLKEKKAKLKYAHPLLIDEAAAEFPNLKIIMAHCGDPWFTDAAAVLYKNKNVYADISGWMEDEGFSKKDMEFYKHKLLEARRYLGSLDKFIFGTDWPISNQSDYLRFAKSLPLNKNEKERILSQNARAIFQEKEA